MSNIFTIISPLLALALIGYLIAKRQWLNDAQLSGLSKVTFVIFIPAFLFYRMATADLASVLNPLPIAAFYLPVLTCFALGFILNHWLHPEYKKHRRGSAVFALGSSYSNNVIVGLPLLLLVIGDQALPTIFLIVTFHSAMLFALTSAIAASQANSTQAKNSKRGINWLAFIKQTITNPLVFGILSGLLVNAAGIQIPALVARPLDMLGQPAITLALIALGSSIAKYDIRGERRFIALASTIKLMLLPLLVYLTAKHALALDTLIVQVLVILSACPTGVNAYLIAQQHQVHRKAVASSVVVSTVASVMTLPLWLVWLNLV
ncbi:AEC family transporter [Thalassotalea euphylliae]|uniref:AEC family transporter n=1 Tax=Thalassotalea euphylliae TaxID=1655234 RepID=UPI0011C0623D|nr:AEC family transporter [Thalassotalea euphylliae]